MGRSLILNKLKEYLPLHFVIELELASVCKHPAIQMSLTIADIVHSVNTDQKTEDKICDLIQKYVKAVLNYIPKEQ